MTDKRPLGSAIQLAACMGLLLGCQPPDAGTVLGDAGSQPRGTGGAVGSGTGGSDAGAGSPDRPADGSTDSGSDAAPDATTGSTGTGGRATGSGGAGGASVAGTGGRGGTTGSGGAMTGGDFAPGVLANLIGKTMHSSKPTGAATWLVSGDTNMVRGQISGDMNAAGTSKFAVFSLYHYYMGSGTDANAYNGWIMAIAEEVGRQPDRYAVLVLEPDSFALNSVPDVNTVLNNAIGTLKARAPNAAVFLDVGHSNWLTAGTVVPRAKGYSNYNLIDGWATNTSNFKPTAAEMSFCEQLHAMSQKPCIIDTSRNGLGRDPSTIFNPPDAEWDPGPPFAFHPMNAAVLFNYYNKPSNERD